MLVVKPSGPEPRLDSAFIAERKSGNVVKRAVKEGGLVSRSGR